MSSWSRYDRKPSSSEKVEREKATRTGQASLRRTITLGIDVSS